jgi:tetratricopeptide (TPR) repeat protein
LYRSVNGSLADSFLRRPFDVWERLMTEARILFDYLGWWFLPRVNSPGLLIHNYPISRSLLEPPITLLASAGIPALIIASFSLRRRFPLASLAVLFFFAAHWLESGPMPLELYFEHRNYLPTVFLFLPVMAMLCRPNLRYQSLIMIGPAMLIALSLLTFQRAVIWGSEERLAYNWAVIHPNSQRAQRYAVLVAQNHDNPELAMNILQNARARMPNNVMLGLDALTLQCRYGKVNRAQFDAFIELISKPYKFRTFEAWKNFTVFAPTAQCRGLDHDDMLTILMTLRTNPLTLKSRNRQQRIQHLIGLLEANSGNRSKAIEAFMEAQRIKPDIERGLLHSSLLATHEYYVEALDLLEFAEQQFHEHPQAAWPKRRGKLDFVMEIEAMKKQIQQDMTAVQE